MSNAIAISDIPKNPATRRVWICGQLRLKGTSLRELALIEGVTHQAMSAALVAPNQHLEPIIADALGLTAEQLFSERFDAETGKRLHQMRPRQRSTRSKAGNVNPAEAA